MKAGGWEELKRIKAVVFSSDAFQKSDLRLKANYILQCAMHKVRISIPADSKGADFPFCCSVGHDEKQLSGGKGLPGFHVPVHH